MDEEVGLRLAPEALIGQLDDKAQGAFAVSPILQIDFATDIKMQKKLAIVCSCCQLSHVE